MNRRVAADSQYVETVDDHQRINNSDSNDAVLVIRDIGTHQSHICSFSFQPCIRPSLPLYRSSRTTVLLHIRADTFGAGSISPPLCSYRRHYPYFFPILLVMFTTLSFPPSNFILSYSSVMSLPSYDPERRASTLRQNTPGFHIPRQVGSSMYCIAIGQPRFNHTEISTTITPMSINCGQEPITGMFSGHVMGCMKKAGFSCMLTLSQDLGHGVRQ